LRNAALTLGLALLVWSCNSDDSEAFSIYGSWAGTLTEATEGYTGPGVEFTLVLLNEGQNAIVGTAQMTVPPEGEATGTVEGTKEGKDVTFTINFEGMEIAGSVLFVGAFQSEDVLSGTVDSGLLGGTFPITFQRQ
jgi:hypothetical protein